MSLKQLGLAGVGVYAIVAVSSASPVAQVPSRLTPAKVCNAGSAINLDKYGLQWTEWGRTPGLYFCASGKGPTPSGLFRFQVDGTEDTVDSFDIEMSYANLTVAKASVAENLQPLLRALFAVVDNPVPADLLKATDALAPGRFTTALGPVNTVYKTGADVRPYAAQYDVHFTHVP
jgi:hypothetical protein